MSVVYVRRLFRLVMSTNMFTTYSIIIHEEKTKEISAMTEVVYVIQNPPNLHELFGRFSQPNSFNIFRIFDEYERLHAIGSDAIYNIRVRVVLNIQSLVFGSSLYIRFNTVAHVVNST